MKRVRNTKYTTSQLKVLLMWALLPIVCFAIAIPMPKWYAEIVDAKTGSQNEKIAWGRVLLSSPDVVLQNVDSIPYFNTALRESLNKSNVMGADITHLFPDYKARKLTLLEVSKLDDAMPTIAVWENNGSFFYAYLSRSKDGDFYLLVKNNGQEKVINLGKFIGRLNVVPKHTIDLASTTLNVVSIVSLFLCLLGCGIMLGTNSSNLTKETDCFCWAVILPTAALLLYVVFWIIGVPSIFEKRYNYPEWIAIAWLLSEVGLLSGILFKMKVESNPPSIPQSSEKNNAQI